MEKVAEYFRNDPRIEIVSISVDANRKAWETKLEKDKTGVEAIPAKEFLRFVQYQRNTPFYDVRQEGADYHGGCTASVRPGDYRFY